MKKRLIGLVYTYIVGLYFSTNIAYSDYDVRQSRGHKCNFDGLFRQLLIFQQNSQQQLITRFINKFI